MRRNQFNNLIVSNQRLLDDNFLNINSKTENSINNLKTINMSYKNNPYFKDYGFDSIPNVDLNADTTKVDLSTNPEYSNFSFKDFGKKIKTGFHNAGKNIQQDINKALDNRKKLINKFVTNTKKGLKKAADKFKNANRNIRNKFRKILRQGIILRISKNAHGTATRLYPAIVPANDSILKAFKPSFISSSKNAYRDILGLWKGFGGNQAELNAAILKGANVPILSNPYPVITISKKLHSFSRQTYYGVDDTIDVPSDTSVTDSTTADDLVNIDNAPAQETKLHGLRAFFAMIIAFFKRHKADSNPYNDNTPQSVQFQTQTAADAANVPAPSEANNDVIDTIQQTSQSDGAGGPADITNSTPDSTPTPDDAQNKGALDTPVQDETNTGDTGSGDTGGGSTTQTTSIFDSPWFWVGLAAVVVGGGFGIYKLATRK